MAQRRTPDGVRIDLDAYCHDCRHRHRLGRTPQSFVQEVWEWEAKHHAHCFEFLSPRRRLPRGADQGLSSDAVLPWWLQYRENANLKIAYASSTAITCTLASLATSATFVAGREAAAIDNTANLYLDYRLTAKITTGTTPTVNTEIRLYGFAPLDDTPTWPDVFGGTDAARTVTNANIVDGGLTLLGATTVTATSNVGYPLRCLTASEAFGHCPKRLGLYVTHATAVNLNSTGSNHVLTGIGAYVTST